MVIELRKICAEAVCKYALEKNLNISALPREMGQQLMSTRKIIYDSSVIPAPFREHIIASHLTITADDLRLNLSTILQNKLSEESQQQLRSLTIMESNLSDERRIMPFNFFTAFLTINGCKFEKHGFFNLFEKLTDLRVLKIVNPGFSFHTLAGLYFLRNLECLVLVDFRLEHELGRIEDLRFLKMLKKLDISGETKTSTLLHLYSLRRIRIKSLEYLDCSHNDGNKKDIVRIVKRHRSLKTIVLNGFPEVDKDKIRALRKGLVVLSDDTYQSCMEQWRRYLETSEVEKLAVMCRKSFIELFMNSKIDEPLIKNLIDFLEQMRDVLERFPDSENFNLIVICFLRVLTHDGRVGRYGEEVNNETILTTMYFTTRRRRYIVKTYSRMAISIFEQCDFSRLPDNLLSDVLKFLRVWLENESVSKTMEVRDFITKLTPSIKQYDIERCLESNLRLRFYMCRSDPCTCNREYLSNYLDFTLRMFNLLTGKKERTVDWVMRRMMALCDSCIHNTDLQVRILGVLLDIAQHIEPVAVRNLMNISFAKAFRNAILSSNVILKSAAMRLFYKLFNIVFQKWETTDQQSVFDKAFEDYRIGRLRKRRYNNAAKIFDNVFVGLSNFINEKEHNSEYAAEPKAKKQKRMHK